MTEEEAKEAVKSASAELNALDAEHRRECDAAIAAVRAKFADRLHAAHLKLQAANIAHKEVLASSPDHPWTGKKVFYEENVGRWGQVKLVRAVGVVEMRRMETRFAENAASYSLPGFGQPFVRLLKKDGSPSVKVARQMFSRWRLVETTA